MTTGAAVIAQEGAAAPAMMEQAAAAAVVEAAPAPAGVVKVAAAVVSSVAAASRETSDPMAELLARVTALGFTAEQAQFALNAANSNLQLAVEILVASV